MEKSRENVLPLNLQILTLQHRLFSEMSDWKINDFIARVTNKEVLQKLLLRLQDPACFRLHLARSAPCLLPCSSNLWHIISVWGLRVNQGKNNKILPTNSFISIVPSPSTSPRSKIASICNQNCNVWANYCMLRCSNLLCGELVCSEHLPLGEGSISVDIHPHEGGLYLLHGPHVPLPELGRPRGLDLQREQNHCVLCQDRF